MPGAASPGQYPRAVQRGEAKASDSGGAWRALACEQSGNWSRAGQKSSERERSVEREVAEWERSGEQGL